MFFKVVSLFIIFSRLYCPMACERRTNRICTGKINRVVPGSNLWCSRQLTDRDSNQSSHDFPMLQLTITVVFIIIVNTRGILCKLPVPTPSWPSPSLELILDNSAFGLRWVFAYVLAKPNRKKSIGEVRSRKFTSILWENVKR